VFEFECNKCTHSARHWRECERPSTKCRNELNLCKKRPFSTHSSCISCVLPSSQPLSRHSPQVQVGGVVWPPPKSAAKAKEDEEQERREEEERKRKFKEVLNSKLAAGGLSPPGSAHDLSHTRSTSYREVSLWNYWSRCRDFVFPFSHLRCEGEPQ